MNPQSDILRLFESMLEDERRSLMEELSHLSKSKKAFVEGAPSGLLKTYLKELRGGPTAQDLIRKY